MLKITEDEQRPGDLKLEGQLIGPWVTELSLVCENLLAKRQMVTLQLQEVDFVDRDGARILRKLEQQGVIIEGCSPFIEQQRRPAGEESATGERDA